MCAGLCEQCLVHVGSIGQGHASRHAVSLAVLALPLGVVQQCLDRPQLCCPISESFTVHLIGINVLAVLGEMACLRYGLVQSALNSRYNSAGLDERLLS